MPQTGQGQSVSGPAAAPAPGDAPPHRYTAALANEIEARWRRRWDEESVFHTPNPSGDLADGFEQMRGRPKFYVLDMFPYPSGAGLHVGHPLGYIATDILGRYKRMTGWNVVHTMGYDAFGLPAEQYAVQTGTHPRVTTEQNIASMRAQLHRLGLAHDPRRSVATTDVSFYRWTQWIFLQIFNAWYDEAQDKARPIAELIEEFESGRRAPRGAANPSGKDWADLTEAERRRVVDAHRLAYLDEVPVNWCPALGTVLANEEVTAEGRSERGDHPVVRRPLKQWMLRITSYAERLLRDLEVVDWPEPIKLMQRNWIGRSEGAHIRFPVEGVEDETIRVFTTRPDTVFGATYMVLAPEHPLVGRVVPDDWPEDAPTAWRGGLEGTPREAVEAYRAQASAKSDVQRQAEARDKTGVFTGGYAVNPASGERIPIFIADYVLMGYGTGAIMAVPAHDERDYEFAKAFELPIKDVVYPRPVACAAWFVKRVEDPDDFSHSWDLALADFVALAANGGFDESTYPELLETVKRRRRPRPDEGAVAVDDIEGEGTIGEKRGVVRTEWLESLAPLTHQGLAPLRRMFAEGRVWAERGEAYVEPGAAVNSFPIDGLSTAEAKRRIGAWLRDQGSGEPTVTYKLRDWLFSRQRYWGEPFPIVYDEAGAPIALPESMLPVELPDLEDFAPESSEDPNAPPRPPLARAEDWAEVELDLGDGPKRYRRETNTMPQWAGSCWYYLRYLDPTNQRRFCDAEVERYWMQGRREDGSPKAGGVDLYVGGVEHAVLHLLYARFWHKILFDLGHVSTPEPFQRLFNQGYIQAHAYRDARGFYVEASEVEARGGEFLHRGEPVTREYGKMGKSLKNAVTPDEVCGEFGADSMRLYEMYMGPLEQSKPWDPRDVVGVFRFLQRLWRNAVDEETGETRVSDAPADDETRRLVHKTIDGVRRDMEAMSFNTAIAKLIELNNHLTQASQGGETPREAIEAMTVMLAPMAPHIAEELWSRLGHDESIAYAAYPEADPALLQEEQVEIAVQVMGKVRGRITAPADADEKTLEGLALSDERIQKSLQGKTVRKVIVVPGRLVNIVAN